MPSADVALATTSSINLYPHPSGVVRGLTILVDFSDQASALSASEIEAWLNEAGYAESGLQGSVRDYFLQQSNGKVDYRNEVHGFYRAEQPKSYYQGGTGYERAGELWREVIAALDAQIDFSLFDNDGDGKTEAISLLYAGDEGTFGKGLWPHAGSSNDTRDGVRLSRYMMTAIKEQPANYVFAHESGHMLFGWPDLYGVGDYCIMANRGSDKNPVGINDVFRADQGWIELQDVEATTNARLSTAPDGLVYRYLNPARPGEYFLWSNVQASDEWVSLAEGGLLIWHFDKAIGANSPPADLALAVVQAAPGRRELAATDWPSPGSAATDLFAEGRNAELSATSSPNSAWNDGSASGLRVYDISVSGPTMQFSVGTGPLPSSGGMAGEGTGGGLGGSGGDGGGSGGSGSIAAGAGGQAASGSAGANVGGNAGTGAVAGPSGAAGANARGGSTSGGASNAAAGLAGVSGSSVAPSGSAASAGVGGMAGTDSPVDIDGQADAGCSCRVGDAAHPSRNSALLLFGAALAGLLRRRQRSQPRMM
jgi:M6 family metalloprotease-like protein/MYXO-CTERM domain-containing protein